MARLAAAPPKVYRCLLSTGAWSGSQPSLPPSVAACCISCARSPTCSSFRFSASGSKCWLDDASRAADALSSSEAPPGDALQGVPLVLTVSREPPAHVRQPRRRLQEAKGSSVIATNATARSSSASANGSFSGGDRCSEPQRHEACFQQANERARRASPPLPNASREAPGSVPPLPPPHWSPFVAGAGGLTRLERAQLELHARGVCPPPCGAQLPPQLSEALRGEELAEWSRRHPRVLRRTSSEWVRALSRGWDGPAERSAVVGEWLALLRSELDAGWQLATSCGARARARRRAEQGYVSLSHAREQMHKSKFVTLDALFIAQSLGRALLEPHVADSRLGETRPRSTDVPPLNATRRRLSSANDGGDGGAGGWDSPVGDPFRGLLLRHYWDLEPFCKAFDVAPPSSYARGRLGWARERVRISPAKAQLGVGRFRLRSRAAVRRAFGRLHRTARVIELHGWWRSATNLEAASTGALGYEGLAGLALSPSSPRLHRIVFTLFGSNKSRLGRMSKFFKRMAGGSTPAHC